MQSVSIWTGFRTMPESDVDRELPFFVNVGLRGTFRSSGGARTNSHDVDAIFDFLESHGLTRPAIHFHGGLINQADGLRIAREMRSVYEQAGCHPITFVWETGPLETIVHNLDSIHRTRLFQRVVKYVLQFAGRKLGGIVGRGPGEMLSFTEIEAELHQADPFGRFDAGARGGAQALTPEAVDRMRPDLEAELEEELAAEAELDALSWRHLISQSRRTNSHLVRPLFHLAEPRLGHPYFGTKGERRRVRSTPMPRRTPTKAALPPHLWTYRRTLARFDRYRKRPFPQLDDVRSR